MTMNKRLYLFISLVMLIVGQILPAYADKNDNGRNTGEFLRIPQGARAVGMGGAFVGIANDITATYWNPAGLIQLNDREILFAHTTWIENINSEYLSYTQPIKSVNNRKRAMAGSLNLMRIGEIEGRDDVGNLTGDLDVQNLAMNLSLAFEYSKQTSMGVNLKAVKQDYAGYKGEGVSVDLGILSRFNDAFSFGAVLKNAGPKFKTDQIKNALPLTLKAGLGYKSKWLGENSTIGIDVEQPKDNEINLHTGIEYGVNEMFTIRLGFEKQTGFSAGLGLKSQGGGNYNKISVQVDYAFLSFSETGLSDTHRFSVITKF